MIVGLCIGGLNKKGFSSPSGELCFSFSVQSQFIIMYKTACLALCLLPPAEFDALLGCRVFRRWQKKKKKEKKQGKNEAGWEGGVTVRLRVRSLACRRDQGLV